MNKMPISSLKPGSTKVSAIEILKMQAQKIATIKTNLMTVQQVYIWNQKIKKPEYTIIK